jgi:23S rRNA pseudouridine2605 synthase
LRHSLGREVSESAVLRAITELWQQLRIIPVVSAPGKAPQWQLLRLRYQKAIAEGASTSQVTAISVLASIYLQAVIAASMEEVEMFLAPLTARSKVREVLRGLVATRQVHSLALGHAPHFYVAGTLPEFAAPPTVYASSSMPASSHFLRSYEHEESLREPVESKPAPQFTSAPPPTQRKPVEPAIERPSQPRENAQASRPRFSHQPAHARDRKPAQTSASGRVARRTSRDARSASARSSSASRHAHTSRWTKSAPPKNGNGNGHGNGHDKRHAPHSAKSATNGSRFHANGHCPPGQRLQRPAQGKAGRGKNSAQWPRRQRKTCRKACLTARRRFPPRFAIRFAVRYASSRAPRCSRQPQAGVGSVNQSGQPFALRLYCILQSAIEKIPVNQISRAKVDEQAQTSETR